MKSYRVSGASPVLGHAPGEEFEAELDGIKEQRLLDCGALALADKQPGPSPEPGELEAADANKE